MVINFKKEENAFIPKAQTSGSAGFDLHASEDVKIYPGAWKVVDTGISVEIPNGKVGLVCSRSGLAAKHGVAVLNAPGVLDSDFRGVVKVILINHGARDFYISKGDRVAQLLFFETMPAALFERSELSETERGEGGLGSTGIASFAVSP